MENEIRINIPEGMEIDKENSTFECIKFKKKSLTYEDVAKELFGNKCGYFIAEDGSIEYCRFGNNICKEPNNATSRKQLEKLLAINKLMNVQKFLCPDYKTQKNKGAYSIYIHNLDDTIKVSIVPFTNYLDVFFPTANLAEKAIDILGEDTIRLALSTDW